MTTEGDGSPRQRLTGLLCAEARRAGLGSREIEAGLVAAKEKSARAAAHAGSPDPLATIPYSKSHVDRVLKGLAPVPSWPFVREFLKVTSKASGLSAEEFRELCETAKGLVRAAAHQVAPVPVPVPAPAPAPAPVDGGRDTVAVLRLEVELERARHKETRLRYALRDAQVFIATICFIVNELREIIADRDALLARIHHGSGDARLIAAVRDDTGQAFSLKRTAETESDRAVARVRRLEGFWEQARGDVQRLALHSDAADLALSPAHGTGTGPGLVPQEFLAGPALDDIAGALAKAKALNDSQDEVARELEVTLGPATQPDYDDEFAVLLAATRLPDGGLRGEAVRSLVDNWADRPVTRETLLRMVDDENARTRIAVVGGLARLCSGDSDGLAALLRVASRDPRPDVQRAAVRALSLGWPGDSHARDVYFVMALNSVELPYALEAMATGCSGDSVVRDYVIALAEGAVDGGRSLVAEALMNGWPGDDVARGCLMNLVRDADPEVRIAAARALGGGWRGIPRRAPSSWISSSTTTT